MLGKAVEQRPLRAVAVQTDAEALGQLEGPLRKRLGMEGQQELNVLGMRFFVCAE